MKKGVVFVAAVFLIAIAALFWREFFGARRGARDFLCGRCNVIIVAFDALQARHVSHLGYFRDTTPHLDALAKEGFSFRNNFSVAPWTVPSFMSYFTSLYPSEHKVVNKYSVFTQERQEIANLKNLSPDVLTMADVFHAAGYRTGGFTGDAGVGKPFGYDQGFEVYEDGEPFGGMDWSKDRALNWLDQNQGKKFFMFFHGYDAHGQFNVAEGYRSRYQPADYRGPFKGTPEEQRNLREEGLAKGRINLTAADVDFWRSWYDGKIRDADDRLGQFLQELKNRGLYDKTVIVAVSDHGTEFYEHDRFDHGFSLYDELLRVPLVIRIPGVKGGKIIEAQVRSIDLFPTLLEIVGIQPDAALKAQMRGISLTPVMSGKDAKLELFAETDYRDYTHKRAVQTPDGWKYILTLENQAEELYNLKTDPGENENLIGAEKAIAASLRRKLLSWMVATGQNPTGSWPTGCLPVYGEQCREK